MVFNNFEQILEIARSKKKQWDLAVASAEEEHALQAVIRAAREDIVVPHLIGDRNKILSVLHEMGETVPSSWIVDASDKEHAAFLAVEMVRLKKADFIMKGIMETSSLLRAILNKETGIFCGRTISHMSLTYIPAYHKLLVITDAAMIISPDLEQKKHIIQNAVDAMRSLGYVEPKVALLASIEKVNPKMQESVDAEALKKMWEAGEITNCIVDGPMAMDLVINKEAARIKGYESPVTGDADIMIMPNMVAGNILSKALREFADTTTVGVVLGAKVPVILTSRGASVKSKYTSTVVVSEMLKNIEEVS
jgi:phosphate butyryltransferase